MIANSLNSEIKKWGKMEDQYARYASRDIKKEEIIIDVKRMSKKVRYSTKNTIQIEKNVHYAPLDGTFFINHSCNPTGYIGFNDFTLRALRDIKKGEEITFHYCTTELALSAPFQCVCGSDDCLGYVRGFSFLNKREKERLFVLLSPYLKKHFNNNE